MQTQMVQILESDDYSGDIARAADALAHGKLLILPTETVYGIAGWLGHPDARAALRRIRGGDEQRPFVVHLARPEDAEGYLGKSSPYAQRVMRKLWPGPIGLSFDVSAEHQSKAADQLKTAAGDLYDRDTITLRCPEHRVTVDLLSQASGGIAMIAAPGSSLRTPESIVRGAGVQR